MTRYALAIQHKLINSEAPESPSHLKEIRPVMALKVAGVDLAACSGAGVAIGGESGLLVRLCLGLRVIRRNRSDRINRIVPFFDQEVKDKRTHNNG